MKFKPAKSATPLDSAQSDPLQGMALTEANPYRKDLGVVDTFKANRAASKLRLTAAKHMDEAAIEASTDVMVTAIEHRRGEQKAALASAAVVRYGAIAQEMVARTAVVQAQLSMVQYEGFNRQMAQRKFMFEEVHRAVARGELTQEELPYVLEQIAEMASKDTQRLATSTENAKRAVDALTESATNHILRLKDKL